MSFFTSVPFILFIIAVIVALGMIFRGKEKNRSKRHVVETFLRSFLFFIYGIGGLIGFISLIFMPERTIHLIGWTSGSPFQFEMGIFHLAYGVIGIMTLFYKEVFWFASVVMMTIIGWGFGIGLAMNLHQQDTYMPSLIRGYMWSDFIYPAIILILFIAHMKMVRVRSK
jgi:hypothetical protein